MKVLVACEFSGIVRDAFRRKGHDAWSCDIIPCESDPKYHIQTDVLNILNDGWDLLIAHPVCTHLSVSGARWFKKKIKDGRQQDGIDFFMKFVKSDIKKKCIENPVSIMSTKYRKPDQIIQPWQFGHEETKAICLWLTNLKKLKATNIVEGRESRIYRMPPSKDRGKLRSIFYPGVADAMADQWGLEPEE